MPELTAIHARGRAAPRRQRHRHPQGRTGWPHRPRAGRPVGHRQDPPPPDRDRRPSPLAPGQRRRRRGHALRPAEGCAARAEGGGAAPLAGRDQAPPDRCHRGQCRARRDRQHDARRAAELARPRLRPDRRRDQRRPASAADHPAEPHQRPADGGGRSLRSQQASEGIGLRSREHVRRRVGAMLRPPPQLTVSEWADRHRMLGSRASAEPGRLAHQPHALPEGDHGRAVPGASGAAHRVHEGRPGRRARRAGNNWLGFIIHQAPGPALAVQPTVELAKRYSRQRIDPLIEETPGAARAGDAGPLARHRQHHAVEGVPRRHPGDDPRDVLRQPALHLFEEGYPVGRAPARVGPGEGGAGCRAEGPARSAGGQYRGGAAGLVPGTGGVGAAGPARHGTGRGGDAGRRTRRHYPLYQSTAVDGLSRTGSVRAFQRRHAAPGRDHQGWERLGPPHADRGGLELPVPGPDQPRAAAAPGGSG